MLATLSVALGALASLGLPPGSALGYGDRPPAGHVGGFGEPDCSACHFGAGTGTGELTLAGLPERYRLGDTYRLEITLIAPDMAVGGVAVTARSAGGDQAGSWRAGAGLEVARSQGVGYLRHAGPKRAAPARWSAAWTAPGECAGAVVFHAAGNAANGDDSALGDRIVTARVTVLPPRDCADSG